ncbi:MAG TPA: hypothetical protein VI997_05465, partial [Candidatus Thermoplasmatota archaeon]|nr:hypothetical protein [Candidatus Thermoplasmatota archaeon]
MTLPTDIVRLALGTAVLAFASWTDWRWRRAPNVLWLVVAGAGAFLLAVDLAVTPKAVVGRWPYLVSVPGFAAFIWVAWRLRLIAGGADAKALMSLAVLVPFPVDLGGLPFAPSAMPGSFAILGNSMIAFLLVPFGLALWNLAHGEARFPHLLLARSIPLAAMGSGHAWPMERVVEGRV